MIEVKDIGQLSQRVSIYSQTTTLNTSTGERTQTFSTLGDFWAKVDFSGGSETQSGDIAYGILNTQITIRYNSSVNDNCIVKFDSKNYNVRTIEYDQQKVFMKLTCESAK